MTRNQAVNLGLSVTLTSPLAAPSAIGELVNVRYAINRWGGEIDADTDNPKRYVNLQGVRVMWPTGRIQLGPPKYQVIPRPLPDAVATIEDGLVARRAR